MKIAFIGTHGVGKTTLCFDLAATLKRLDLNVDIVREVARDCPLPINKATTLAAQSWILHTQCAREIVAAAKYEMVICDRSVIDNYAYLVQRFQRRPELEPWITDWLDSYGLLVKVPIWRPPAFDGLRDTDRQFQKKIDEIIDDLLYGFQIRCLRLHPDQRESWIPAIVAKLGFQPAAAQLSLFE